jgi:hypothetical protein
MNADSNSLIQIQGEKTSSRESGSNIAWCAPLVKGSNAQRVLRVTIPAALLFAGKCNGMRQF